MKIRTPQDLGQSLTLLHPQQQEDGEGGWREEWRRGPRLWASITPLQGGHGFHPELKREPMISQHGYLKAIPPARYRLILRAEIDFPQRFAFLWHLYRKSKFLAVISSPTVLHSNRFVQMIAMEDIHASVSQ